MKSRVRSARSAFGTSRRDFGRPGHGVDLAASDTGNPVSRTMRPPVERTPAKPQMPWREGSGTIQGPVRRGAPLHLASCQMAALGRSMRSGRDDGATMPQSREWRYPARLPAPRFEAFPMGKDVSRSRSANCGSAPPQKTIVVQAGLSISPPGTDVKAGSATRFLERPDSKKNHLTR
jgi:hypothetical protein